MISRIALPFALAVLWWATGKSRSPARSVRADGVSVEAVILIRDDTRAEPKRSSTVLDALTANMLGVSAAALLMWWLSLRSLGTAGIDDFGIIDVLPVMAMCAPLLVLGALAISFRNGARDSVLVGHLSALVIMLHGAGAVLGSALQARIVLRHEGVADVILRTGTVDPNIDVYFNWPGFFSFLAYLREVTGIEDFSAVALWAPVFFNLLYLAPLLVIMRRATTDERTVWSAIVLFLFGNWVGQDYLSPQAISYGIYLTIVATLLTLFSERSSMPRNQRALSLGIVIALFASIVPSHQLTPVLVAISVGALVLVGRCQARRLPILMGTMVLTWAVFMSATYLDGNLRAMLDFVGDIGAAADSNLTERLGGSEGHRSVVTYRLAFTAVFAAMAGVGWLRSVLEKTHDRAMTALVVAPVLLLVLQPYGGEMVLRVFFFSLPFLAFYAARAFRGLPGNRRMWKPVAGMTLALILLLAFYVTRYGNARLDVFSDQETQAIAELYDQAPGGSLILAVVDSLPWKDRRYEVLDHKTLNRIVIATLDPRIFADAAAAAMYGDRSRTSYFVATSSQQTYIELLGGAPPNTLGVVEDLLRNDPNIDLIVDEPDVRIYELPTTEVEQ